MNDARPNKLVEASSYVVANKQTSLFAYILMEKLSVVYDPESTKHPAATDGETIRVGPAFLEWTLPERVFVLCHEILHAALDHLPRAHAYKRRGLGADLRPFSMRRANVAMDYVINDVLVQAKIGHMPTKGLHRPGAGDADKLWDKVYLELPADEEQPNRGEQQEQSGDQGGSQDQQRTDGGFDGHDEPPPETTASADDPNREEQIRQLLKTALRVAEEAGALPGALRRLIETVTEPQIPWAEQLADYVESCAGRDEQAWSKPNRRRLALEPDTWFPGKDGHRIDTMVVAPDVSGSVTEAEFAAFMAEIAGIVESVNPETLWFMPWDGECAAHQLKEITPEALEDIDVSGGGGTQFSAVVDKIAELDIDPSVVVCLTDGYVPWPDSDRVWWDQVTVITRARREPPFGDVIRMEVSK